ncbi:Aldolase-type TIM barrel [Sesbania bispinosa]|nr:Aldolase-type TIM barrel [Sesbania bispinosa]
MGEPLNNYSAVVESVSVMTGSISIVIEKDYHLNGSYTSSQKLWIELDMIYNLLYLRVGIIHAINKLHNDLPGLNLAVSLHAPAQDIRCQIMPAARAFPLEKLMDSLQEYQRKR